jgi:hypothetical protein
VNQPKAPYPPKKKKPPSERYSVEKKMVIGEPVLDMPPIHYKSIGTDESGKKRLTNSMRLLT